MNSTTNRDSRVQDGVEWWDFYLEILDILFLWIFETKTIKYCDDCMVRRIVDFSSN